MTMMKPSLPAPHHPLHLVIGQAVWLTWFGLAYGGLSVACAAWPPDQAQGPMNWVNAALLAATALTAFVLAWAAWAEWRVAIGPDEAQRPTPRFVARASAVLYAASAGATLFVGLPLLLMPPCI